MIGDRERWRDMKILLPKQHGAWAMLLIPFLLGMIGGEATIFHLPFLFGWLFLYLATVPIFMLLKKKKIALYKKWSIIYISLALVFLVFPLYEEWRLLFFSFAMIPFFLINVYFTKSKKERAFLNDVSAIIIFGIGGLASYFLGSGTLDGTAWLIFIYSFFFFLGSTFYVKSMIREKKNQTFKWYSWGYHIGLVVMVFVFGHMWLTLAYVPSLIRAIGLYGKPLPIMKLGILEIGNSFIFFMTMIMYLTVF
jgi:hypothetical protein